MHIPFVLTCRLGWRNCAGDFASHGREARRKVDGDDGEKDCRGRGTKEGACIGLF
jgi:hypothetical protein